MARSTAVTASGPDTRERILESALHAFAVNGFDGATTRDIASQAGVNLGLIKYYFDGKQNLWRAAVDRAFETLRAYLDDVIRETSELDDRDRTERLVRRFVHFVGENPEFIQLMHDEGRRRGPRMRWIVDRHVRPIYEVISGMLERARARGVLPAHVNPVHFHYILVGAVALIFHQAEECRRLTGVDPADDAVIEAHADAVVHLLLGPANPEESA